MSGRRAHTYDLDRGDVTLPTDDALFISVEFTVVTEISVRYTGRSNGRGKKLLGK